MREYQVLGGVPLGNAWHRVIECDRWRTRSRQV